MLRLAAVKGGAGMSSGLKHDDAPSELLGTVMAANKEMAAENSKLKAQVTTLQLSLSEAQQTIKVMEGQTAIEDELEQTKKKLNVVTCKLSDQTGRLKELQEKCEEYENIHGSGGDLHSQEAPWALPHDAFDQQDSLTFVVLP